MGVVNIDTLENEMYGGAWWSPGVAPAMDDTKVLISNNIHWVNPLLDHYYNGEYNDSTNFPLSALGWEVPGTIEVENVPPIFLNDITTGLAAAYGNIVVENNWDNDTDPLLVTPSIADKSVVDSLATMTRRLYGVSTEQEAGPAWVFGDYDANTVPGIEVEDGDGITKISDLVEDFTYTSGLVSGIDSRPIGALHWWAGEMDTYDEMAALAGVKAAWEGSATAIEDDITQVPTQFKLGNAYPNPFNPTTTLEFTIARQTKVNITIHNELGQQVATLVNKEMPAGVHQVTWDATGLASGLYFYTMEADNFKETQKMMLVK
jgi:hypothetical protein